MTYGDYMDRGDGLGYDDIEPYNDGYDEALSGIFSSITSFIGKAGGKIGSVASQTFQFTKKYAVKGWDFTKKYTATGWKFAKKLPSIGKKAISWTYGKVIKPSAKWSAGAVKSVYKWKGWKPVGNRMMKVVGGTVSAGLQLIDTLGQAFIMTAGGEVYPAPTGTTQPQTVYQQQPDSAQYPQPPEGGQTGYPPSYYPTSEAEYLPVDLDSGWVYNPETGEPIREATQDEIAVAEKKKKSIWGYVIAGIGVASLIL